MNLSITLSQSEQVRVDIYSLKGTLVKSVDMGILSRGEQKVSVTADGLVNGTYLLKVTSGAKFQVAKFVVAR